MQSFLAYFENVAKKIPFKTIHPTFTHQLFQNEQMSYLTREEISKLEISIYINAYNLEHSVNITGIQNPDQLKLIQDDLSKGLPSDTVYLSQKKSLPTLDTTLVENALSPCGKLIHTFTRTEDNITKEYFLHLATFQDINANLLLTRAEKIAMWFIETADSVQFSDPRWEVLILYEKQKMNDETKTEIYQFIGYMTLFTFHNPFQGDNLRVCQALIFPEKQHLGLGRELLLTVYKLAEERENVIQVTVEDPSPGFQRLRNAVDFEWFIKIYELDKEQIKYQELKTTKELSSMSGIAEKLKIIKLQAYFVKEAADYIQMIREVHRDHESGQDLHSPSTTTTGDLTKGDRLDSFLSSLHDLVTSHPNFHEFRLAAKKNLVKNDPDLKALEKSQLQQELAVAFEDKMIKYRGILKTAHRLNLLKKI